jgi:hypothetical protein
VARSIRAVGDVRWDEGQIRILLSGPGGETSEEIQRRARAVQRRAQSRAPIGATGNLRGSITVNTRYPSEGAEADITAEAPYAGFVEFGRRSIDLMGTNKWLRWMDGGTEIFAQKVKAVGATHFMSEALDEAGDG